MHTKEIQTRHVRHLGYVEKHNSSIQAILEKNIDETRAGDSDTSGKTTL